MIAKSFLLFFVLITSGLADEDLGYKRDSVTNAWFKMHDTPTTWSEALTECEIEDAMLATPLTIELRDAILRQVTSENQSELTIYTGVYANITDVNLFSIEGAPISNLPVILEEETCIAWETGSARLRRVKCTDKFPFVCYKNVTIVGCGNTHLEYIYNAESERCYKFHTQGLTWNKAYRTCQAERANLAVANNQTETAVLQEIYDKYPNEAIVGDTGRNVVFVGIRDRLNEKSWMTVDGLTLAETAFEWDSTEPNNIRGDEYCGSFGRGGKLYDDSCNLILPFICEKRPTIMIQDPISFTYN